jgi:shikimate kinase
MTRENVVLTGFMGTGKTAVGKRLASRLKMAFLDTDGIVEETTGLTIPEIFRKFGEERFRLEERRAVARAAAARKCVIATGGGVVLNPENVKRLRESGYIVLLEARPEVIAGRVGGAGGRPLLNGKGNLLERIAALLDARAPYYRDCDLRIDTSDITVDETVTRIIRFLQEQGWVCEGSCGCGFSAG